VLQAVLITTLCCCYCLSCCNKQHLKSLEADAVAAVGLSFGSSGDGCSCVLAHALGLPAININGNPLLRGPPSVPQVLNNEAAAASAVCCHIMELYGYGFVVSDLLRKCSIILLQHSTLGPKNGSLPQCDGCSCCSDSPEMCL
jgi:hypothetical protein